MALIARIIRAKLRIEQMDVCSMKFL